MITRNEFIEEYAKKNGLTKKQARSEIERFLATYKSAILEHGGVDIRGFMKATVAEVPEKILKHPKTQEKITIPAHKAVKIKVSKKFAAVEN